MKDEKILSEWYDETYKIAVSEGLRTLINKKVVINHYMSDVNPFNTVTEEKDRVTDMLMKTFSDFENITYSISVEGWSESNVRLSKDGILW